MLVPLFAGPGHRAHRMVQTQDGEAAAASTGVLGAGRRPAPSQRHCSTLDAHKTRDVCMLEKWSASVQKAGSTGEPGCEESTKGGRGLHSLYHPAPPPNSNSNRLEQDLFLKE